MVSETLRILSLNLAHGRNDAINQMLVSREQINRNLAAIAVLLRRTGADIVTLQEADGPSRWSGGFDHVSLLANQADYGWYTRASHAQTWLFDYGTAVLSRVPFKESLNHAFQPTPPSMTKGFSLVEIPWRTKAEVDPVLIDVISVHLDFSRDSVRARQIAEITAVLAKRRNPLIVMGDFNSDWLSEDSVVTELARRCGLQAYQPMAENLPTYFASGRRLDWVLISDELEFLSHAVLPDAISDHQAIVADIGWKTNSDKAVSHFRNQPRCSP